MRIITTYFFLVLMLFSCKDNSAENAVLIANNIKEKELKFQNISKAWNFAPRTLSPESQSIINNWNEWRLFNNELLQKPKTTIGAFQRKTKVLVQKSEVLITTIPPSISQPQIKARLMAMITKLKALHTFINLDRIPEKKVIPMIVDLNIEINVIQDQIEEIVRRSQIQKEEGEMEMLNTLNISK